MATVITIGEILVEIMRPVAGISLDQLGEFQGPYPSGAPAIFAVAAARLGLSSAIIGAVGRDAFGRVTLKRFVEEGVDTAGMQFPPGFATGCAFVSYDADGGREFVFHLRHAAAGQLDPAAIPVELFEAVRWLHLSGSTLALNQNSREACQRALVLAQEHGAKISLDPNLRLELMPLETWRDVLTPYLKITDLLLPTASEARSITGELHDDQAAWALMGKPGSIVVLKRGPEGCSIYQGEKRLDLPGFAVEDEVDPTGAGDCFSAAFIAGLEMGWSLEKVGRFANTAGALAVTRMGPMEGAPTWEQVEAVL
jgi:sugar/nucleoside kinase (ribokinase family)